MNYQWLHRKWKTCFHLFQYPIVDLDILYIHILQRTWIFFISISFRGLGYSLYPYQIVDFDILNIHILQWNWIFLIFISYRGLGYYPYPKLGLDIIHILQRTWLYFISNILHRIFNRSLYTTYMVHQCTTCAWSN